MLTIKEIKELLTHSPQSELIKTLESDERKGVKKLLKTYYTKIEKDKAKAESYRRMQHYERIALKKGYQLIAGTDEAGRGPLAGPVVAAAVILPDEYYLPGLNDSKKLSESQRESFYTDIMRSADVGVGIIHAKEIDQLNILNASKKAMIKAISELKQEPEFILADAVTLNIQIPQESIIKGDAKSVSIAAASVIAKVTRDRLMKEAGAKYPGYGFERNAGYGTKDHVAALNRLGPTGEHRRSFEPVKSMVKQ
ncbi:ribonuclease HII [Jeotgalibacillus salarius]|uniref:Ribonuclease HII n=1 Tax=Jeotgalibacillus salarius TaxID=546023 RepID=A0A4Y8LI86_9BACL|nr:ribonuclease HII [Jeotgalibacillus salarius]TFE02740.1 ribonuclease HII [Jeotgalibacillus salarius]